MQKLLIAAAALAAIATIAPVQAANDDPVLNIYSARGEATDEALYNDFIKQSGIAVNRSENDSATTLESLKNEGKESKADVVLLDGLANLHDAESSGLFRPVHSDALNEAIPESLRAKPAENGGTAWFGLARRARIIVYDPDQIDAADVSSYEQLADEKNQGRLCLAPLTDAANLVLVAALIEHDGSDQASSWLEDVARNLATPPAGSDTDQIRAVAAGRCGVTLAGHFYLARLMRADNAPDRDIADSVAVVFPNQDSWGTHMDVAGAAVARHAPHADQAVRFLEYLVSEQGQNLYANSNDEWPIVAKYKFDNDALEELLGEHKDFKADRTPLSQIASHLDEARKLTDSVAFK
ncbi:MAG: extracellular solute-binding protein [Ottowia sp.]